MKTITLALKPLTPFHIGRGLGLQNVDSRLHADMVYSAICWAYRTLYGVSELNTLLSSFKTAPPFTISSPLPRIRNVCFLPKIPIHIPDLDFKLGKKIKGVEFFSEQVLAQCAQGNAGVLEKSLINLGCIASNLWMTEQELASITKGKSLPPLKAADNIPRTALDRTSFRTMLYYATRTFYHEWAGFWMAFRFHAPDGGLEKQILACLRFLGDEGLGGERAEGHGQFSVGPLSKGDIVPQPSDEGPWMNLAPYWPLADEIPHLDLPNAYYRWFVCRGWISQGTARKRTVRMFEEGCVFPRAVPGKVTVGGIANVTPQNLPTAHEVYRFGYAFPVPVRIHGKLSLGNGGLN